MFAGILHKPLYSLCRVGRIANIDRAKPEKPPSSCPGLEGCPEYQGTLKRGGRGHEHNKLMIDNGERIGVNGDEGWRHCSTYGKLAFAGPLLLTSGVSDPGLQTCRRTCLSILRLAPWTLPIDPGPVMVIYGKAFAAPMRNVRLSGYESNN